MEFKTKTGKKTRKLIERDKKVISPSLTREYEFAFKNGKGVYLFDLDGKKYIDFAAGVAVNALGYNNKFVLNSIKKQLNKGIHIGFSDFYCEKPVEFAELLLKFVPKNLDKMFFSNSGTESIECAMKLARWHTRRKWCISFHNSFHGRTFGSLSLTDSKKVHKERFEPFLPVKHVPYPDIFRFKGTKKECVDFCLKELEKTINGVQNDVAAIFLEPIQGEGGYIVPPSEFVKGVREICDKYRILLVADEVQSGCFRTGKFLCMENYNVKADIVCLSKAIGGGLPMGITLSSNEIMNWVPSSHANTLGGNMLACAAGIATLEYMKKKKIWNNVNSVGDFILRKLRKMQNEFTILGDVRGIGLMIGNEFVDENKWYNVHFRDKLLYKLKDNGLICLGAGKSAIRFCPPLIINKKEAEKGLKIFEESMKEIG